MVVVLICSAAFGPLGAPTRKNFVLVRFFKGIDTTRALLSVKWMVTKTSSISDAIVLHHQGVHVSTRGIILIVLDAQENLDT